MIDLQELKDFFTSQGYIIVDDIQELKDNYCFRFPTQDLTNINNLEEKLALLLLSNEKIAKEYIKLNYVEYKEFIIDTNISIQDNYLKYAYSNSFYKILEVKPYQNTYKFKFIKIQLNDEFFRKYNLSQALNINIIYSKYLHKKEELERVDEILLHLSFKNQLIKEIKRRYNLKTEELIYTNEITENSKIYSIADKNILRTLPNIDKYNSYYNVNQVTINPNLSYFFKTLNKTIPLEHLFALFDVDTKEFSKVVKKVSTINIPIVSIGVGGVMSNFLYYADKFREYFGLTQAFKQLLVFEPDNLEFSNLFRIPLNWKDYQTSVNYENNILKELTKIYIYNNIFNINKSILLDLHPNISHKTFIRTESFSYTTLDKAIFIGAPTLNTRINLYESYATNPDIDFICPTHFNNTLDITIFPNFRQDLVVETYGTLDINKFMLTMFKMTIEVYKLLASGEYKNKQNHKHLVWDFKDNNFKENSQKHKCLKNIVYVIN